MTRQKRTNFLDTLLDAQKLAFAPFIFKACSAALKTGLLDAVVRADHPIPRERLAGELGLTPYAVAVMTDILKPAGVLEENEEGLTATKVGSLLVLDDMTRANFFFTDDVNYVGLSRTLESLTEGRPAGLSSFNPSWKTIYPHLPELPDAARKAWFRFDHYHSDRAYQAALDILAPLEPKHLVDIGGNTGRFTREFLLRFPQSRATLVDLPVETEALRGRPEMAGLLERLSTVSIDWLTDMPLRGTEGGDLYWMSQFLDCFSPDEAVSILKRIRAVMAPGAVLAVLEPIVDEQRHQAAELSLAATSLYFTVLANGNSRFFAGAELRSLFKRAGFTVVEEHHELGISHTLFILKSPG
ncbi:MAG: methyltransferase [Sutterella sp.]